MGCIVFLLLQASGPAKLPEALLIYTMTVPSLFCTA